jgi:hypothetical protein
MAVGLENLNTGMLANHRFNEAVSDASSLGIQLLYKTEQYGGTCSW